MSELRNFEAADAESAAALEGADAENEAATQDSDCEVIETRRLPPQASKVLEKAQEAEQVEQDELATLRENLRAMVNDPKHSDVRFVCQDGGKVFASRMFLVARSPMLQGLLSNGMAESRMDEIELPTVTTSAMLAVVEFLYTGCIVSQQVTWVSAFEILHASVYLLLDNLRDYVMTYLSKALEAEMDGEFAAWCLTELAESATSGGKHLLKHSLSARLVRGLVSKIENADPYSTNNLSASAFNLYLDATESVNDTSISLKEYLRLRCILLWACTRLSPKIESDLRKCLPDEKWLRNSRILATSFRATALPSYKLRIGPWIEKLDKGWSSVCLDCIHPVLLSEVVEPLGVIPMSVMLSAFRNQAVNAGNRNLMTWDKENNKNVEILENGTMLRRAADSTLSRPTTVHCPMLINHGLWECDVILEGPGCFVSFGLEEKRHAKFLYGSDSGMWIRWLSTSGDMHCGQTCKREDRYCGAFNLAQRCKVRVRVDMALRTCAFTIEGKEYGTAWSDIPDEVCFRMAIGASSRPVTARIKLASDPDFV